MTMLQELENYANEKREFLEKRGVKMGVKRSEIRPKLFKLSVTMETDENAADFTVWDKGSKLPIEADVIVLNVPSSKTTISKSIQPKQAQELIDAFDELTDLLITRE